MRLAYPDNVKIVHLPCTGRVDQAFVLRALEKGVDGVYGAGCLEGNCHFETAPDARLRTVAEQNRLSMSDLLEILEETVRALRRSD